MLHRQQQTELENSQMKMQLKYQAKYADSVQRQEETVCKLRHDLKTTISALRNFQINRKYDEMGEYLQAYDKTLSATESIVNTNQSFVNAILNTKISYAKEQGIICSCHSPKQLPEFAGEDYCSLLGNLLDNAIEASVTLKKPEITVTLDYCGTRLNVIIKNRIELSVLENNPNLHTTKRRKHGHGYGIETIKEIAKKYHGSADFYESDGWFIAAVDLYESHNSM